MGFWKKLFGGADPTAVQPPAAPGPATMKAIPLVVSTAQVQPGQAGIDHARYRLDAIARTIEQESGLTTKHLMEFQAETRQHVHTLITAGLLNDEEGLSIVKMNRGMRNQ